jgi:ATP-dependent Zn protease
LYEEVLVQKSNARKSTKKLQATAYHEAGHAVLAWGEKMKIHRITIKAAGNEFGHVANRNPLSRIKPESKLLRDRTERFVRICLAGRIAQRRFAPRGYRTAHDEEDRQNAAEALVRIAFSNPHQQAYMDWLSKETALILDDLWPLVKALAHELLSREQMGGKEVEQFIETYQRARVSRAAGGRIHVSAVSVSDKGTPGRVWI